MQQLICQMPRVKGVPQQQETLYKDNMHDCLSRCYVITKLYNSTFKINVPSFKDFCIKTNELILTSFNNIDKDPWIYFTPSQCLNPRPSRGVLLILLLRPSRDSPPSNAADLFLSWIYLIRSPFPVFRGHILNKIFSFSKWKCQNLSMRYRFWVKSILTCLLLSWAGTRPVRGEPA